MCFDYNVNTVIMLCKLEENGKEKCVEYWEPEKKDILESVNDYIESKFKIDYKTEEINEDIIIRTCNVLNKETNEKRVIQQIHYGGWPDHEIPKDIQTVYGNILFMFNIVDKLIGKSPICVHCSAGVGRTGTFIALYNLYKDILMHRLLLHRPRELALAQPRAARHRAALLLDFGLECLDDVARVGEGPRGEYLEQALV